MRWQPIVLAWALGAASALGYVAASGGWYEYRVFSSDESIMLDVLGGGNKGGWQPVSGLPANDLRWIRRPRLRLPY